MSRLTRLAVCAAGLTAALAAPAGAATTTTSVTLGGGTLDYTTPLVAHNLPNVTLNGLQQTVTANVDPYAVTDSRGGSAGWNLSISASQFTGTDTANKLPTGSLSMALPPVPTTTAGNLAVAPVVQPSLSPIDGGSSQKVVSAAALPLSGQGKWTFTPLPAALTLTIPPAVTADTYTSTITTTLSTGP